MLKPGIFTTRLDIKTWAHFSFCNHCRSFTNYNGHNFPSNAHGNHKPLALAQTHPRKGTTNFSPFRNHGLHGSTSPAHLSGVQKATWFFSLFLGGRFFNSMTMQKKAIFLPHEALVCHCQPSETGVTLPNFGFLAVSYCHSPEIFFILLCWHSSKAHSPTEPVC